MKVAATSVQDEFPSLDFPGRTVLYVHEVAERLGCCQQHILDLMDEGEIPWVDLTGKGNLSDRRSIRIPIEGLRIFLEKRTHNRPSVLSQAQLRLN